MSDAMPHPAAAGCDPISQADAIAGVGQLIAGFGRLFYRESFPPAVGQQALLLFR